MRAFKEQTMRELCAVLSPLGSSLHLNETFSSPLFILLTWLKQVFIFKVEAVMKDERAVSGTCVYTHSAPKPASITNMVLFNADHSYVHQNYY